MTNKIVFTGSHGVGKTTLAMLTAGKCGYKLLPDVARIAMDAGFKINEQTNVVSTFWMFSKQAENEQRQPTFVGDKCFIDLLAYVMYFKLPLQAQDLLFKMAEPFITAYDLVVYLPAGEFPIPDDGYRSLNKEFQKTVDRNVIKVLHYFQKPYIQIVGTPRQRFRQVQALIGERS